MPRLCPHDGSGMVTPAALPAAAPRPAEHLRRQVRTGVGCWVSLHGCHAELVIGGGGKATLAGGPAAVPGVPAGLGTPRLRPRFYGHGASSCGGGANRGEGGCE